MSERKSHVTVWAEQALRLQEEALELHTAKAVAAERARCAKVLRDRADAMSAECLKLQTPSGRNDDMIDRREFAFDVLCELAARMEKGGA